MYMDDTVSKLINVLKNREGHLIGYKGEKIYRFNIQDTYYFEAIERKAFAYFEKDTYEIKEKLYQIEEKYGDLNFVRISKSMIVNIDKMVMIYPAASGTFELELDNGEILKISRYYAKVLKQKLGMVV